MTPEERERRIEAAARAFYEPAQPEGWVVPPVLLRNMTRAFKAAEEAVPTISEAEATFLGKTAGQWAQDVVNKAQSEDRLLMRVERAEAALMAVRKEHPWERHGDYDG